uniref:Uncharacterized protein n=1 Tax=Megaselia scalaris TaxID=36166 RepID=T1GIJ5_MEGSC
MESNIVRLSGIMMVKKFKAGATKKLIVTEPLTEVFRYDQIEITINTIPPPMISKLYIAISRRSGQRTTFGRRQSYFMMTRITTA